MGREGRRRIALRACTLALAASAAACVFPIRHGGGEGPIRPPGSPPPEADPSHTTVALLTSEPIPAGRNVMWSVGMQLAWDALGTSIGGEVELGGTGPKAIADGLARQRFPASDLDPASAIVEAGFARTGVQQRFESRVRGMGGTSPLPAFPADPTDIVALAYVRKELPFRHPFHVREGRLAFAGGPRRVVAFGIDPEAEGRSASDIAAQAVVHAGAAPAGEEPKELVVELLPRDDADRIVLAAIDAPATLDAGWARVRDLLREEGQPLPAGTDLAIPKVDFGVTESFDAVVGAPVLNLPPGSKIRDARERIELLLSERGASFVTSASVVASCAAHPIPRRIHFDRPYLLALMRRGASRPYFVAWLGNDDLFVKG